MLKSTAVAALLAMSAAFPAFADGSGHEATAGLAMTAERTAEAGCHGASDAWLPGTLRIEERGGAILTDDVGRDAERSAVPLDCALV